MGSNEKHQLYLKKETSKSVNLKKVMRFNNSVIITHIQQHSSIESFLFCKVVLNAKNIDKWKEIICMYQQHNSKRKWNYVYVGQVISPKGSQHQKPVGT